MKPWIGCFTLCFLLSGLWFALLSSPADYQQGDTVRIMYVHVPCAWMAMFVFLFLATFSLIGLIWRHPLAYVIAQSAAPIG
ncbi:MAG: cytochrome c biogenesis protein CcsA, partial [Rhodospirillaceae bacterium]